MNLIFDFRKFAGYSVVCLTGEMERLERKKMKGGTNETGSLCPKKRCWVVNVRVKSW